MKEVMRLKEAAEYVRVSEKTLRELAKARRVPCQRVGREWRFLRKVLDEWLSGIEPSQNSLAVSEPVGQQLYLPDFEKTLKQNSSGFGDTAFTKNREEPLHSWVPWIAGFSASFVYEILERESRKDRKLNVLDPFAGVGTTLVEGLKCGCNVVGFEINPYAALSCRTKMEALKRDADKIRKVADRLRSEMRSRILDGAGEPKSRPPEGFKTREPFFSPKVERQILFLKDIIEEQSERWLRDFMRVALGAILVGVSNYSYEPSLGRRSAVGKSKITDADIPQIVSAKLFRMARDIEYIQANLRPSHKNANGKVFNESFLQGCERRLGNSSVDVLITSPPYLNNYHYVRNTRPQMYWLDFVRRPLELKELETSSFGKFWQTVRSEPKINLDFTSKELEEKLETLRSLHPEKGHYGGAGWANYAVTYFNDCNRFCRLTSRTMSPGGLVVVVIGNNILQGIEFKTDLYFAQIAEQHGFEVIGLHEVRKKRTGTSIVNSSVRVGAAKVKTDLYETAVELRKK